MEDSLFWRIHCAQGRAWINVGIPAPFVLLVYIKLFSRRPSAARCSWCAAQVLRSPGAVLAAARMCLKSQNFEHHVLR